MRFRPVANHSLFTEPPPKKSSVMPFYLTDERLDNHRARWLFAARVSAILRPQQEEQTDRPLHEDGTTLPFPQAFRFCLYFSWSWFELVALRFSRAHLGHNFAGFTALNN